VHYRLRMRVITPSTLLVALAATRQAVACDDTCVNEVDSVQDLPAGFARVRQRHGGRAAQLGEPVRARHVLGPARMWNIGLQTATVRVDLRLFVRRENARPSTERWSYNRLGEEEERPWDRRA